MQNHHEAKRAQAHSLIIFAGEA